MHTVRVMPGTSFLIGTSIRVTMVDLDPGGARLRIEGQLVGGAEDGLDVHEHRELGPRGQIRIGSLITIIAIELHKTHARLGVLAPTHMPVSA
jgi:sRNA-binding carbon storage regulator CsrA